MTPETEAEGRGADAQPGVRPPDFVKIDVEGLELPVLDGMEGLLREHRPVLLVELDDATSAGHAQKAAALQDRLAALGYRVERLPDAYRDIDWVVSHWHATPIDAVAPPAPDEGEIRGPDASS